MIAYGFTVLLLKRSILTEKIARRGFHLSREYSVDPLEILFAREVMRTTMVAFAGSQTVREVAATFRLDDSPRGQHLYPILSDDQALMGVITRKRLRKMFAENPIPNTLMGDLAAHPAVVAYADEPLSRYIVQSHGGDGINTTFSQA